MRTTLFTALLCCTGTLAAQGLRIKSFSVGSDQALSYPNNTANAPYLTDLPDEHTTVFPPASAGAPYVIFAASALSGGNSGAVVLQTTDLTNFTFATALGYSRQVMAAPVQFTQCNPTYQTEFDGNYAAPGSVVQDPTLPAGNLIMIYEAENHCPGGVHNADFYATVGFARSSDNGKTWPAPANGPNGGAARHPALQNSIAQPTTAHGPLGDAIPSAFVDKNANGDYYLYVIYEDHMDDGTPSRLRIARAKLGGDPLTFLKWNNGSFSEPGIGGADTPFLPATGCTGAQNMGEITRNDDLGLYMALFVCTGNHIGTWYYSTATSLDLQDWSAPQPVANSQFPSIPSCSADGRGQSFDGWYPSSMSPGAAPGHTKLTGQIFFMNGCDTGQRQFMSRQFTITTEAVPLISKVANAEGENAIIAPNTWIEIKGSNLAPAGDTRIWEGSDFTGGTMPTQLDNVGVTVNGKAAFVYYISPTQINVLTPPDTMPASVQLVVTNNAVASAPFTVQAQALSPSFFVFDATHVAATHADGSLLGPASLYPGSTTPAKPGEVIVLYANGFGPTTVPLTSGSATQSGTLSPLPVVTIGGVGVNVQFAGLVSPGEFQFNVVVPSGAAPGDQPIVATYNGQTTQAGAVVTIAGTIPPTSVTLYVSPSGKDSWSGTLAAPNAANSDGPFATFDRARAAVQALNKTGLAQISVQFRGGTYFLPATVQFTAADSGSAKLKISYQNYSNESPVFSGGVRVQNWTNTSGNLWKTTLPASVKYFENLYYNGVRRLRPRLGGYLGAYYRVANTVYIQGAAPPAAAPDPNCSVYVAGSGWECFDRFQYNPSDPISGTWKNLAAPAGNLCKQPAGNSALSGDIEVLIWEQFSTSKLRISCIDTANHLVYLTGPTGMSQSNYTQQGFITGNRYLVENVQDQLTQPGQWFLDRSTTPWTLTYLANTGENPNTDEVIVPQLPQVLVSSGLQYVTFQGLTFEHDNYTVPPEGHQSAEQEADISAAVSFQNSSYITFDGGTVAHTAGTGLEFLSCLNQGSPDYCASLNANAVTANNTVQNSAFYDIGVLGIRVGDGYSQAHNDANVPQSTTVQNNVVEGYGRVIPASFGIGQGFGHDNLYTHNDVYDGYHCAVSIAQGGSDTVKPNGIGNANNMISFNHVWNLLQGIMNDGGSIRIAGGNHAYTAPGNKILNNKIHDVSDASALDSNGYGGHGVYLDNDTGLVTVENNLVYRVSGSAVYTPHGPSAPNEANIVRNNILAYAQDAMIQMGFPYQYGVPNAIPQIFNVSNNLMYFDRSNASSPKFFVQGGCVYAGGAPFPQFQQFSSNLYWRTDGGFAAETKAFAVQPNAGTGPNAPCSGNTNSWTFFTFAGWQAIGEDAQSVVQNPGFANPAYPADDYSLPKGSPGVGFVVFDAGQAGRNNPLLKPPAVPATFPTKPFNPATDY